MTAEIQRSPQQFSNAMYDTVIVGGGIYGAMLLLEAARKGLSALMIERSDFGSGTTAKNFRILHGGLRSLQSGDLYRYRESVAERNWFLRTFPDLVEPMQCLMPYYGRGTKRTSILRLASVINDILSVDRNNGVRTDRRLGPTTTISRDETIKEFSLVNRDGLKGGLVWHDAKMPDCHRILIDVIRWACEHDAKALNYVSACGLISEGNSVTGVRARDMVSGDELEFRGKTVICATGPWTTDLPVEGGVPAGSYFPSRAWNVLLDRPPVCRGAVAVSPELRGGPIYFVHSYCGKLFVGTGHSKVSSKIDLENDVFPKHLLEEFLDGINRAITGLELKSADVLQVLDGFLPVVRSNSVELRRKSAIVEYGDEIRLNGLFLVVGVKFTTARATATKVMERVCRKHFPEAKSTEIFRNEPRTATPYLITSVREDNMRLAKRLIETESVISLDDLMLRRIGRQANEMQTGILRKELQESSTLKNRL